MEILQQFGIEGKLLVVQLINFLIFALVMWRFVLPRLTKLLDQRRSAIEDSLAQAETARKEAEAARTERDKITEDAKAQAAGIISQAQETATVQAAQIMENARTDAAGFVERTERNLAADRERLTAELRAELAGLTVSATRAVLGDALSAADRERILRAAVNRVGKELPKASAGGASPRRAATSRLPGRRTSASAKRGTT